MEHAPLIPCSLESNLKGFKNGARRKSIGTHEGTAPAFSGGVGPKLPRLPYPRAQLSLAKKVRGRRERR